MDSFIQLFNNRARCIGKGCSELVKNSLTVTISGCSKAKKISNNKLIFRYTYSFDIAEVYFFYRQS